MPSKKKTAFAIFMNEKKPEIERKLGRKVTMKELPVLLYEEWQTMPEQHKKLYRSMCGSNREKCDSRGISISLLLGKAEEERKKKQEMQKDIIKTADLLKTANAISKGKFFVIYISHYIQLEDGSYVPAEIGMCQFSFSNGIISQFHKILPAEIPSGYRYEAMQHSDSTHNLLLNVCNKNNVNGFEEELYMYLSKDKSKSPIVYTHNDFMEGVESMLDNFNLDFKIKVYSLDYLFHQLYSACLIDIPETIATHIIMSSEFEWAPHTACTWHEECAPDAIKYCALNCCKRWIFNMCNGIRLQDTFGVVPIKGKHIPELSFLNECVESTGNGNKVASLNYLTSSYTETVCSRKENVDLFQDNVYESSSFLGSSANVSTRDEDTNSRASASSSMRGINQISNCNEMERTGQRKVGGLKISCLGLSGFGRGMRKVNS